MKGNLFLEKIKEKNVLIMSHRGFWGGNIIENTIESSLLAFKAGADIVEVDVCKTNDGGYYLFHDGNEQKLLGRNENFKTLSSLEIEKSIVYNSLHSESGYTINSLSQFLEWLPYDKLVNIDRSWHYWEDSNFFKLLSESGNQNQIVLKSPVQKEYLDFFSGYGKVFHYIPIIKNRDEFDLVESYSKINMIGLEMVVEDLNSELLDPVWMKQIKQDNLFVVANAENLGSDFNLFAHLSDDGALLGNDDWTKMIELGVDVLQTDWPNFLFAYLKKRKQVGE